MQKTALITGITGQDGSYLAEHLLGEGYTVEGVVRAEGSGNRSRIAAIEDRLTLHTADLLDQASMARLIERVKPHEIYHLAAQTFIPTSWAEPIMTAEVTGLATVRILDAIREVNPEIRFYQASSSEVFGQAEHSPQNEKSAFRPRNPYATAKHYAHSITANYRDYHGLFACSGILFNHESPRRNEQFVTRKITRTAAKIRVGQANELRLGNLLARRDWGFAGDYVRSMRLMLQLPEPEDFVIGTGEAHSVGEFVEAAFSYLGLDWKQHVVVDSQFYRPAEVHPLIADPRKAHAVLGWRPQVSFEGLVRMMVDADLAALGEDGQRVRKSLHAA
ncbi:MAG: GDP-mannose 4,6-dehydratase [Planctomycetales bacterium]|nr:GDP-mannose 4,6-dehydratase [Planctomycetales bacterium]